MSSPSLQTKCFSEAAQKEADGMNAKKNMKTDETDSHIARDKIGRRKKIKSSATFNS